MSESQKDRVWSALQKAAERIALAEYKSGRYKVRRVRGKVVQGYSLSSAHQEVLDAMDQLGRDEITPEQAMAVLHGYDVLKARTRSR